MSDTNPYWPLPAPDSLGGMVGADDVRNAVKCTIETWAPYYIAVLSQRLADAGRIGGASQNPDPLPNFGKWVNDPENRSFGTGKPAAFLVTSPATSGTPSRRGDGNYWATWRVQINVQVYGTSWEDAADLTSWYEKVVRWCLLQHASLDGTAKVTKWAGIRYAGKIHSATRTEGQAICAYDVVAANVVNDSRGPASPPVPQVPPPDDFTVLTTSVTLDKVPDTESLESA